MARSLQRSPSGSRPDGSRKPRLLLVTLSIASCTAIAIAAPPHADAESRHSAGFQGIGLYAGSDTDHRTRFGALSAIGGLSSRLHGPLERHYLFTRGDARLRAGLRLGPEDDSSEFVVTGSLAFGVQLYRIIPVALYLEDIQLEVIGGDPHARLLLATGATLPFDVIFDIARETVLVGSAFSGVWINQPGASDEYLAYGARIDYLSNHVGAQASTIHLIDNAAHRQQLRLFVRDLWEYPVRLGLDYERAASGSNLWLAFVAWGLTP